MRKTSNRNRSISNRLAVSTERLVELLDCGRATAVKIGNSAGARIQIGKRVLWNTERVQEYLNSISESEAGGIG